jgi:hypothetical protein
MKNLKVLKAIREECLTCLDGHYALIKECQAKETCLLWPFRMGVRSEETGLDPFEAIKKHCLECAGSLQGVYACPRIKFNGTPCSLHPFRLGCQLKPRKRVAKPPETQLTLEGFDQD